MRRPPLVMLVLSMALVAAACGSDAGASDPTTTTTPAATTTTTTAAGTTTTAAAGTTTSAAAATVDITSVPVFSGDDFYAPPDPLPAGEPGDVIWVEPLTAPAGSVAYKVLYHSEAIDGRDIAVSGFVMAPDQPAPAGGYPVVSWAHGTTGLADSCTPSDSDELALQMGLFDTFIVKPGYVFVATDYEGLGTPGTHPYIVGDSEGRGALDMVRAARQITELGVSNRVVVWGHSQGGHAALFAGEIASTYAPDLDVVGIAAGAPPSTFADLSGALETSPFRGYMVMVAEGFAAAYPDLDLSQVFSPEVLDMAGVVDTGCVTEIITAYAEVPDMLPDDMIFTEEPWATLLEENEPGHRPTGAPIIILHGEADEQIPLETSATLLDTLCDLGDTVSRKTYPDQTHAGVVFAYAADLTAWIADRFADNPAPNDCG